MESEIETLQNAANIANEFIINYGFQFLGAIIILIIGWQVAKWVSTLVFKLCGRTNLDITLSRFFAGIAKTVVLAFVVIIALVLRQGIIYGFSEICQRCWQGAPRRSWSFPDQEVQRRQRC